VSHIEIERKFLVIADTWKSLVTSQCKMKQGYLTDDTNCSLRVRISDTEAWLNIKSVTVGAQRYEFEYAIPMLDGEAMLSILSCKPIIEKTRYYVPMHPHIWEIDVFEGDNLGLVVAEIELDDPDEPFNKPVWLGEEVTFDIRYYNTQLSQNPFKHWF